jgi:general secretion pathway protein J
MNARRGHVLLELVVAIAIFAVLAALAYGALDSVVRTRAGLDAATVRLKALQLGVSALERDLRAAIARPVRGPYGETRPALQGTAEAIELTHHQYASPVAGSTRAALGRATWTLDQESLVRSYWATLDRAPDARPILRELIDDCTGLRLRYLDAGGAWRDAWPARDGPDSAPDRLPRAVEFRIVLRDAGEFRRIVELPDGPAPPTAPGTGGAP